MAVNQILTVVAVSGSANVANNTSQVRILWQSTQSGDSHNDYTRTAYYYVSVNGGAETKYSVSYTLPKGSTAIIVDKVITVTHNAAGAASVKVRTYMDTRISAGVVELSKTVTLPTIARASTITSASKATLGGACRIQWTPMSKSFYFKLKFKYGSTVIHTTPAIGPNTTSQYTYQDYYYPYSIAENFPNSTTSTMSVSLVTYTDASCTTQVGSESSVTIEVQLIGNHTSVYPTVTVNSIAPVHDLGSALNGMYIQSLSKVLVDFTPAASYGARIVSTTVRVDGKTYSNLHSFTTEVLSTYYGLHPVVIDVVDSRGFTGRGGGTIEIIPYSLPTIGPVSGQREIVVGRCDEGGNLTDSGTSLKIMAKRTYAKMVRNNAQTNFGELQYRYLLGNQDNWSSWITLLAGNNQTTDEYTGVLLTGALSTKTSCTVEVRVVDTVGKVSMVTFTLPADKVYMHRDGARNSIAFGKYVEKDNCIEVGEGITIKVWGEKWKELGLSSNVGASASNCGRGEESSGCFYRVVSGNHVHVAFNCACSYTGAAIRVNAESIPDIYRPGRNVYAMCAAEGRTIARVLVNESGNVMVEWIQDLTHGKETAEAEVSWIDGYIDYFV